jgi:general secretion pathway protein C
MQMVDQKRLTVTALLLAVVLAAWVAADTTWTLLAPELVLPSAEPAGAVSRHAPRDYGKAIGAAHLLGEPERRPVRREVPVTRLDLELLGVYHTSAADGFAIIRGDGDGQKLYRRGAVVSGNATLSEVRADHVVLDVDGRMESLYLDKDKRGTAGGVSGLSDDAPVSERLAALRRRAIADPVSLGKMIEATPVRRGGRMQGFQIRQRSKDPLFRDVGLRDGDVLVEINGIRLDQPSKGFEALQELANAQEVTARVERAGRSFTIRQRLQ